MVKVPMVEAGSKRSSLKEIGYPGSGTFPLK
jgi:hypothetical protein